MVLNNGKKKSKMRRRFLFRYLQRLSINPFLSFKLKYFRRRKWKKYKFFLLPRFSRLRFSPYEKIALRKYGFERLEKNYKSCLFFKRTLSLIYGNLRHKTLSNEVCVLMKQTRKHVNLRLLFVLESRLDITLVRSNFAVTIQQAQAWIRCGLVKVNGVIIKSINFYLCFGDKYSVDIALARQIIRWIRRRRKSRMLFLSFYNLEILPQILTGVFLGYDRKKIHENFCISSGKRAFLHKMLANYYFFNYEHDKLNVFFR